MNSRYICILKFVAAAYFSVCKKTSFVFKGIHSWIPSLNIDGKC